MNSNKSWDDMTGAEKRKLYREILRDDGRAAKEHLAAGRPIFYREPETPTGHVIKEYPNGHRKLIRIDHGVEIIVSDLPTAN